MGLFGRIIVATLPYIPKPVVGIAAMRYVAGETINHATKAIKALNNEGAMATLDVLGEEVQSKDRAISFTNQYVKLFDAISNGQLDSNVSVKPTMLGLKLDEDFCLGNLDRICSAAKNHDNFLRIDMEDNTTTDATLRMYQEMQSKYGNVGVVLQSYMRRTVADIEAMPNTGVNIRLCKGIYVEPEEMAFKEYSEVQQNFLAALTKMIEHGVYPAIATHDDYLVEESAKIIKQHGLTREEYEFQMLYGVKPRLRKQIIRDGHRMRVYVPFGEDWHPYSIRRLRENPDVAIHVAKALIGLN